MKRLFLLLTVALCTAGFVRAQDITAAERKRAVEYFEKTRAEFLKSTDGLSEAQWTFKQAPDRWSIAEVAEHIAAVEDGLMGLVQGQVMKAPARTEKVNDAELDELVVKAIPDRSKKAQSPEPFVPTKRFGSPDKTLAHFKESRAKSIAFLKDTKDLRGHAFDSPLGKLDGYQWLLFIAAHSERHTKQINEVKADANYPKK